MMTHVYIPCRDLFVAFWAWPKNVLHKFWELKCSFGESQPQTRSSSAPSTGWQHQVKASWKSCTRWQHIAATTQNVAQVIATHFRYCRTIWHIKNVITADKRHRSPPRIGGPKLAARPPVKSAVRKRAIFWPYFKPKTCPTSAHCVRNEMRALLISRMSFPYSSISLTVSAQNLLSPPYGAPSQTLGAYPRAKRLWPKPKPKFCR